MKNIQLYNGDCLEIMENLIQKGVKVDAVITDPPYNISRENNFNTMGRGGAIVTGKQIGRAHV